MRRILKWSIAGVVGAVIFFMLLWQGPWWFDGAHLRKTDLEPADGVVITGFRTTLVAIGAGIVAGLGLYYTDRNLRHTQELFNHTREKDREEAELIREGQVTGRYVEAIKLLGSDNMTEQLGGIYALERIMRDSERDHSTVVEVLAAYIRHHASAPGLATRNSEDEGEHSPEDNVQAALTVLGRRPQRKESFRISLVHTDLRGADLIGAHLIRANLDGACLTRADLSRANLTDAYLREANLSLAHLSNTRLDGADLVGARLEKANLYGAKMEGIDLEGAYLEGANLSFADLKRASLNDTHMASVNLAGACLERAALWDANLTGADLRNVDFKRADDLSHARLEEVNLRDVNMERAKLRDAHLERANLGGIHLENADLRGAHLESADLGGAYLTGADLSSAQLKEARLSGANLQESNLSHSSLQGADLSLVDGKSAYFRDADLRGTYLDGADLSTARGLTTSQLVVALLTSATVLPNNMGTNQEIRARITECEQSGTSGA